MSVMFAAYQRGWQMLSQDQQFAALRGAGQDAENVTSERRGNIQDAAHSVMRGTVDLDSVIDESLKDGRMTRAERKKIRLEVKKVMDRLARISSHVAEPVSNDPPVAA